MDSYFIAVFLDIDHLAWPVPVFVLVLPLFPDSGTLFDDLILVSPEILPERKLATLKRPDGIDCASFLGALQKDAFKIVFFSKPFFDGQSVADSMEIFLDAIDGICL